MTPTSLPGLRSLTLAALAVLLIGAATADAHPHRRHNPPGLRGGPGTTWQNPPGPRGGPGASPASPYRMRRFRDRDHNPPGPVGGRGTNWENPPGPRGGPGTSPDRRRHRW
jgi:hypothetical protein